VTRLLRAALAALVLAGAPTLAEAKPAPDFSLRSIANQQVSLSDYKGKVVILSFWATWCGPCKKEMPYLQKMRTKYADQGFEVISVSVDDVKFKAQVVSFIRRMRYDFPVLLDSSSEILSSYNPNKNVPFTVLIGRDGQIEHIHTSYNSGDEVQLEAEVVELLGAGE